MIVRTDSIIPTMVKVLWLQILFLFSLLELNCFPATYVLQSVKYNTNLHLSASCIHFCYCPFSSGILSKIFSFHFTRSDLLGLIGFIALLPGEMIKKYLSYYLGRKSWLYKLASEPVLIACQLLPLLLRFISFVIDCLFLLILKSCCHFFIC